MGHVVSMLLCPNIITTMPIMRMGVDVRRTLSSHGMYVFNSGTSVPNLRWAYSYLPHLSANMAKIAVSVFRAEYPQTRSESNRGSLPSNANTSSLTTERRPVSTNPQSYMRGGIPETPSENEKKATLAGGRGPFFLFASEAIDEFSWNSTLRVVREFHCYTPVPAEMLACGCTVVGRTLAVCFLPTTKRSDNGVFQQ